MPPTNHATAPDFGVPASNNTQLQKQKSIAAKAQEFANVLAETCPQSLELNSAFSALRTVQMWANQSIIQPTEQTQGARG
jgi:hypothetical protein